MHASTDKVLNPSILLCENQEAHCYTLAESFRNYNYNYARGIMTVYVSTAVNREGATYVNAVTTVDDVQVLKEAQYLVVLDGLHR